MQYCQKCSVNQVPNLAHHTVLSAVSGQGASKMTQMFSKLVHRTRSNFRKRDTSIVLVILLVQQKPRR